MAVEQWSCVVCKHLVTLSYKPKCKAFPEGIPFMILSGEVDHRMFVVGDNGIRFEPIK